MFNIFNNKHCPDNINNLPIDVQNFAKCFHRPQFLKFHQSGHTDPHRHLDCSVCPTLFGPKRFTFCNSWGHKMLLTRHRFCVKLTNGVPCFSQWLNPTINGALWVRGLWVNWEPIVAFQKGNLGNLLNLTELGWCLDMSQRPSQTQYVNDSFIQSQQSKLFCKLYLLDGSTWYGTKEFLA